MLNEWTAIELFAVLAHIALVYCEIATPVSLIILKFHASVVYDN